MSESHRRLGLALPTGELRASIGELLSDAGLSTNGYEPGSRLLRSDADERGFRFRIFRERDIPIQVALGNYDIGICSDVWVAELQARFPYQRVTRLGSLPGPSTEVWLCASPSAGLGPGQVPAPGSLEGVRIATELPNLADLLAARLADDPAPFEDLARLAREGDLYLGCSCPTKKNPDPARCHSVLAVRFMGEQFADLSGVAGVDSPDHPDHALLREGSNLWTRVQRQSQVGKWRGLEVHHRRGRAQLQRVGVPQNAL